MGFDYDIAARLLREFDDPTHAGVAHLEELCEAAGLSPIQAVETAWRMTQRHWLAVEPGEFMYSVPPHVRRHIGKSPAQLLALDIATWVTKSKTASLRFPDPSLPEEIRDAPRNLIVLALRDLELHQAVKIAMAIGGYLHATVMPGMAEYEFGKARSSAVIHVEQHVGDVVGRDKNVASDSGVIVTGNENVVVTDGAASRASLEALVAELRKDASLNPAAVDRLAKAATPGISEFLVAEHASQAVKLEPRLLARLGNLLKGLAATARDEVVAIGVRILLQSAGAPPQDGQ